MHAKLLIGGLLASVMILPALAQSSSAPPAKSPAATSDSANKTTTTTSTAQGDMWRASKLIGLDVYNDKNEKLGDISELLVDKSGKVDGVVIGVGGFLGMGEHDIKVDMSKLKFVDQPVKTSKSTNTTTTGAGGMAPSRATTTTTSTSHKWYPDHAVLSGATKDQLKSMTQFKF
jgi:sporulation protein YlmC with PRC-barrel domain